MEDCIVGVGEGVSVVVSLDVVLVVVGLGVVIMAPGGSLKQLCS